MIEFREDIPFLLNEKKLTGFGAEIGVLRGEFSDHLLKYWKGKKLYLIDAWRNFPGKVDFNNPDHNGQLDNIAKAFMSVYPYNERATLIRELSSEACNLFKNEFLDFIYLDAAHDFETVYQDLVLWYPKIKKGGIFFGHDYLDCDAGHTLFGVKSAVDTFAKERSLEVFATKEDNYPNWAITIPE